MWIEVPSLFLLHLFEFKSQNFTSKLSHKIRSIFRMFLMEVFPFYTAHLNREFLSPFKYGREEKKKKKGFLVACALTIELCSQRDKYWLYFCRSCIEFSVLSLFSWVIFMFLREKAQSLFKILLKNSMSQRSW